MDLWMPNEIYILPTCMTQTDVRSWLCDSLHRSRRSSEIDNVP